MRPMPVQSLSLKCSAREREREREKAAGVVVPRCKASGEKEQGDDTLTNLGGMMKGEFCVQAAELYVCASTHVAV